MGRAGRPQGDPRGATEQANALARFLCEITGGVTVRELGERYHTSKTTWSDYRSGTKIIPWPRLEKTVTDHVRDARGRAALLAKARHLHTEASEAEQGRRPPAAITAAEAQRRAETDLAHAEKLAQALLRIIAALQEQLPVTAAPSADATSADASAPSAAFGPEARGARERLRQAQTELTRVEKIRATAQEVQATAHGQYLNAVAEPVPDAPPAAEGTGPARAAPLPAPRVGVDLEIRLTRLHDDVRAEHQNVAALWGQISRLPMEPIVVPGEVLGRADNPLTSTDAGPGPAPNRRGHWPGRVLTALAIVLAAVGATAGTVLYLEPESSRHDVADPSHTPTTTPTTPAPTTSPPGKAAPPPSSRRSQPPRHAPDPARTPPSLTPKDNAPEKVSTDPPPVKWSNGNTRKCLQVDSGAMEAGALVVQWGCNGEPWQQWRATVGGTLTNITNHNSDKCLEVRGGGSADGAGVVQWGCNGELWQQWRATRNSDGSYRITNHFSGKCLEIRGGGTADGAGAVQWECNGEPWQKWWQ